MISKGLKDLLDNLRLSDTNTVFFYEKENWKSFTSKETQNKLDIIKPTAFYVFNNRPYILFFDLTESNFSEERENNVHKQVWSFDQSPVIFILKDSDVEIFNAFAFEKKRDRLQKIAIGLEERNKLFSFWNLASGKSWNWMETSYYKTTIKQKRVSQKLFDNIKAVREKLINEEIDNPLSDTEANTLILRLIFIRYLIDRNVKLDATYIQGDTINAKRKSLVDLIAKPRILNKFFEILNVKLNGVLFKDIKFELSKEQATALAGVFSGEIPKEGTLFYSGDYFFKIFDFSIIPVELISGIYESLIDPETRRLNAAVYTPPFLVEYILSETVDKYFQKGENRSKTECKIFDPSVGSGIFLVQSYRRMVDRVIAQETKISKVRLREIAENNLFGIDIEEQALKVTCFSLYIAMLDYQDPKTLLDNFHFPTLIGSNLFVADFFDTAHAYNDKIVSEQVNFISGNPPWKSDKNDYHTQWLSTNNIVVGRNEIAQSFLLRSKDFMHPSTVSTLIVTSTIFYNVFSTTKDFKKRFLTDYCVDSFFDLSPVRRIVFEEKKSPCAIVQYRLSDGESHLKNLVKHQSLKYNIFLKYYKALVIEKFDQKEILQKHFLENDWMFKVALYGNTLDYILLKKIAKNQTKISQLIDNKIVFKGAGIKSNKGNDYADFLIGLPLIENSKIQDYYTHIDDSFVVLSKTDVYYESGRVKELFLGKKILLKEQARNESDIVVSYVERDGVYKNGVSGIVSSDETFIKVLYCFMISKLYTYFIYITSGSWGISTRPQVRLDEEYLSFPFIKPTENNEKAIIKLVDDFLKPFKKHYESFNLDTPRAEYKVFDAINKLVDKMYQIQGYEKDLIDYVLDVSRYQFQESKLPKVIRKVYKDNDTLEKYVDVFFDELKDIFQDEYLRVDVYSLDHFIALNFVLQKNQPEKKVNFINNITDEQIIFKALSSTISIFEKAKDLFVQKDIKGFEENSFYIIKPNEYKCWHRAMAWYDVAEIKEAIEVAEIDYLKNDWDAS